MTTAIYVLLLVIGIAAVLAVVFVPIVLVFRRRYHAAAARLAADIEAETVIRPLEKGVYEGATAPGYPGVRNNGRIALTRRRLVFVTVTGKTIDVPLDTITGLREAKVFNGAVAGGFTHLIVRTADGEIGFYVSDNAAWLSALGDATGLTPDRS